VSGEVLTKASVTRLRINVGLRLRRVTLARLARRSESARKPSTCHSAAFTWHARCTHPSSPVTCRILTQPQSLIRAKSPPLVDGLNGFCNSHGQTTADLTFTHYPLPQTGATPGLGCDLTWWHSHAYDLRLTPSRQSCDTTWKPDVTPFMTHKTITTVYTGIDIALCARKELQL
jgi:hypothetical protein